jgi:ABC-2 type transport system permease protein
VIYKKALTFITRDFLIATSYRFAFSLQLFGVFFSVLTFYFLAKMFEGAAIPSLEPYGGDYFSFVLIGIAFSTYLMTGLSSFSGSIRNEQMMGTLEAMLVTPTTTSLIIICSSLWNFIFASIRVLAYLLIGVFLFDVNMRGANLLAALLVLILTIIAFSSLGIISASFIIVLKRGDPINWALSAVSGLLGGVFYPITVLPHWLQNFSYILPITYSLRAMRHALLQGYSFEALAPDIAALLLFSLVMLPISILAFKFAVRRAKVDGSLVQY